MFKDFIVRKMMETQLKHVPQEQREMLIKMFSENPDFFQQLATEIQEEVKGGKDQMAAAMEVMRRHQSELEEIGKKAHA